MQSPNAVHAKQNPDLVAALNCSLSIRCHQFHSAVTHVGSEYLHNTLCSHRAWLPSSLRRLLAVPTAATAVIGHNGYQQVLPHHSQYPCYKHKNVMVVLP